MTHFSTEEVNQAVKSLKLGKCLGLDGLSGAFYKQFGDVFSPVLCNLYNKTKLDCPFNNQTQEAQVTLIAKTEKDPTQCSSYRSLSLINVDLKAFAKIVSIHLQTAIPSLEGLDQVGFVPKKRSL